MLALIKGDEGQEKGQQLVGVNSEIDRNDKNHVYRWKKQANVIVI